ncbi:hypothetical protein [Nonomuraea sp. NPDC002799]
MTALVKDLAPGWLVIASVCDCPHVAITIMHTSACDPNGSAEADGDEIVLTGPGWRDLIEPAARALAARTGLRISAMCTTVMVKADQDKTAISNEATDLIYAMAETTITP